MGNEGTVTTGAAQPAQQNGAAKNISDAIQNKANGKTPEPAKLGQDAAPVDPNAGKKKFVVSGREVWLTPDQMESYAQKGIAFEPKVTQLGHLQNETAQFLNALKANPVEILSKMGFSREQIMEKIYENGDITPEFEDKAGKLFYDKIFSRSKMTPEQLKALENEKKLSVFEKEKKDRETQTIENDNRLRIQSAISQLKAKISEAMQDSGLPNNDTPLGAEMARMVADTMRVAHFQRQAITPKQAIELVKRRIKEVQSAWYESLDEDSLVRELGESTAEKVKKHFLKLAKDSEKNKGAGIHSTGAAANGRAPKMTRDQFFGEYMAKLKGK